MKNSGILQHALPSAVLKPAATLTATGAAILLAAAVPSAHAQAEIALTYIDKAGNAADTTGYGAVSYNYYIGTTEVTNSQYAAFLNSVAKSDPYGLYNSGMSGTYGGITREGTDGTYVYTATRANAPVNFISFFDAARFCNWLTNGANAGASTETGMYTVTAAGLFLRNEAAWLKGAHFECLSKL